MEREAFVEESSVKYQFLAALVGKLSRKKNKLIQLNPI